MWITPFTNQGVTISKSLAISRKAHLFMRDWLIIHFLAYTLVGNIECVYEELCSANASCLKTRFSFSEALWKTYSSLYTVHSSHASTMESDHTRVLRAGETGPADASEELQTDLPCKANVAYTWFIDTKCSPWMITSWGPPSVLQQSAGVLSSAITGVYLSTSNVTVFTPQDLWVNVYLGG